MTKALFLLILSLLFLHANSQRFTQELEIQEPQFANSIRNVESADIDGDGDMDIIAASDQGNGGIIHWYENNGEGIFSEAQIISISTNSQTANAVYPADIDGDGDLDILSAAESDSRITWLENEGEGNFGDEQLIIDEYPAYFFVSAADLDGDGDLDVLCGSSILDVEGRLLWFENNGLGVFTEHLIDSVESENYFLFKPIFFATDVNGDSFSDVIVGLAGKLVWYQNDGFGNFGDEQIISFEIDGTTGVKAADLDSDGDIDVVCSTHGDDKLTWYENDGSGGFGGQNIIEESTSGPRAFSIADLDQDNDLDIVLISFGNELGWYANDGFGNFNYKEIISEPEGGEGVATADFDNDGDLDIVAGAWYDQNIVWFENEPDGSCESSISVDGQVLSASEGLSYQWYNNGEVIFDATSQEFTVFENGTYTVVVNTEQNCNATSEGIMIVGISELESETILLYPNPMTDRAYLEFEDASQRTVTLLDANGKVVRVWNNIATQSLEIRKGDLASGNYILTISNFEGRESSLKLVVD